MSNGLGIQSQQQQQRVDPNHTTFILVDEVASEIIALKDYADTFACGLCGSN